MTAVLSVHHAAIATKDLPGAIAFYTDVLDLTAGPTPSTTNTVQWMYAGDHPILHIFEPKVERDAPVPGTYGVAHIALTIEDFDAAKARLVEHGIAHDQNIMESQNARQLFFDGPDGVRIELIEFGKVNAA